MKTFINFKLFIVVIVVVLRALLVTVHISFSITFTGLFLVELVRKMLL